MEMAFIDGYFNGPKYHVGYKYVDDLHGILNTDNSKSLGIFGLVSNLDRGPYIDNNKCAYAEKLEIGSEPCQERIGICRKKIGPIWTPFSSNNVLCLNFFDFLCLI